jgi:hypothetical protein
MSTIANPTPICSPPFPYLPAHQTNDRIAMASNHADRSKTTAPSAIPGDFISTYTKWADVIELPWRMHEAAAIQLVASLLNRHDVHIKNGSIWYPMDLWMVLLSDSGGGRSTLLDVTREVIKIANVPPLINRSRWGSAPAMFQNLANANNGTLCAWGELSEKLSLLSSGPFKQHGAKQWLTDRYDSPTVPDSVTYRKTGKSGETPPIDFTHAPRLNILATSSNSWFYNFLTEEDTAGGWLPRWVFFQGGGKTRSTPRPPERDPDVANALGKQLETIAKLKGHAIIPESIWLDYDKWYVAEQVRFESHRRCDLAVPYFQRYRGVLLKLAVIYQASMSGSLEVSWDAWERAKGKSTELSENLFGMLDTGMTAVGHRLKRYEDRIREAGTEGLLKSEFTRAFQTDHDREANLATLEGGFTIHHFWMATKGRRAQVLIHRDYCNGRCDACTPIA